MKNKISMELKNPITQQGFEIICKQLIEKDKEIEELKRLSDMQDKTVVDLTKTCKECREKIAGLEAQIEKAKDIIKKLLELNYSEFTKTNVIFLQAGNFLKETECN